jgi:hypothetical protein
LELDAGFTPDLIFFLNGGDEFTGGGFTPGRGGLGFGAATGPLDQFGWGMVSWSKPLMKPMMMGQVGEVEVALDGLDGGAASFAAMSSLEPWALTFVRTGTTPSVGAALALKSLRAQVGHAVADSNGGLVFVATGVSPAIVLVSSVGETANPRYIGNLQGSFGAAGPQGQSVVGLNYGHVVADETQVGNLASTMAGMPQWQARYAGNVDGGFLLDNTPTALGETLYYVALGTEPEHHYEVKCGCASVHAPWFFALWLLRPRRPRLRRQQLGCEPSR